MRHLHESMAREKNSVILSVFLKGELNSRLLSESLREAGEIQAFLSVISFVQGSHH